MQLDLCCKMTSRQLFFCIILRCLQRNLVLAHLPSMITHQHVQQNWDAVLLINMWFDFDTSHLGTSCSLEQLYLSLETMTNHHSRLILDAVTQMPCNCNKVLYITTTIILQFKRTLDHTLQCQYFTERWQDICKTNSLRRVIVHQLLNEYCLHNEKRRQSA